MPDVAQLSKTLYYGAFAKGSVHESYRDREYGFRVTGDAELFERLMPEVNQAGLSWATILRKRAIFAGPIEEPRWCSQTAPRRTK